MFNLTTIAIIPVLITSLIFFLLLAIFFVFNYKKKSRNALEEIEFKLSKIKNLPISTNLKKIYEIAHENRRYQIGYNVWNYIYKNDILVVWNALKDKVSNIRLSLHSIQKTKLIKLILELEKKILDHEQKTKQLLCEIKNFLALNTFYQETSYYLKSSFRKIKFFFNNKKLLAKDLTSFIENDFEEISQIFKKLDDFMKNANFVEAKIIIENLFQKISKLIIEINIALQIKTNLEEIIPNSFKDLKLKISNTKKVVKNLKDKVILTKLDHLQTIFNQVLAISKTKKFSSIEKDINFILKQIKAFNYQLDDELIAKNIFEKEFVKIIKVYQDSQIIAKKLIDLISKFKFQVILDDKEQALITTFIKLWSQLKEQRGVLKQIPEITKQNSYFNIVKILLKTIDKITNVLQLVYQVYNLLEKKESNDLRFKREIREISIKLNTLSLDFESSKYTKENLKIKNNLVFIKKEIEKINQLLKIKPRNITKISNYLQVVQRSLYLVSFKIYQTIEEFKNAESVLMWLNRFIHQKNSEDLQSILTKMKIAIIMQKRKEITNLIKLALETKVVKKYQKNKIFFN